MLSRDVAIYHLFFTYRYCPLYHVLEASADATIILVFVIIIITIAWVGCYAVLVKCNDFNIVVVVIVSFISGS